MSKGGDIMKKNIILAISCAIITILASSVYASNVFIELKDPVAIQNIGYEAYQNKDYELAEKLFQKAITLNTSYEHARMNLAVLYNEQGRYDEAIEQLNILVALDNKNEQYWYDLGVNLIARFQNTGVVADFYEGLNAYKQTAILNSRYAHVQENIAVLEKIQKEFNI